MAADDDQRGPRRLRLRRLDRGVERVEVVRVGDVLYVPALGGEPGAVVLGVKETAVVPSIVIRLSS